jgi:glutamyl/glutaminyl-tRNA synthetase
MEIPWTEGPKNYHEYENEYLQIYRLPLYTKALTHLREHGHVYACTCSRSRVAAQNEGGMYPGTCRDLGIPLDTPGVAWRLFTDTRELTVKTLSGTVKTALPSAIQDFIVRKKDGFPAYQLASLVDDIHFDVDLIVRGDDLWHSTLAQVYLSSLIEANTFSDATFHHHKLLSVDGEKLSKSAGATSIQYLRGQHKSPADIYVLIAEMLGVEEPVPDFETLSKA